MKEVDKRKASKSSQTKGSRTERRGNKVRQDNSPKTGNVKETQSKTKAAVNNFVSDSNTASEPSETYESLVIHYVDDINKSEEDPVKMKDNEMVLKENKNDVLDNHSTDIEKQQKEGYEDLSDAETIKDSVSSQGDSVIAEDEKLERISKDKKTKVKLMSSEGNRRSREKSDRRENTMHKKVSSNGNQKESGNSNRGTSGVTNKNNSLNNKTAQFPAKPSSESSDGVDEKPVQEIKELDVLDGTSNGTRSLASEDESDEKAETLENCEHEQVAGLESKVEEMEIRIEKLEEELREVAALEISLYSVVPEHGSSAHKVHTPARRLSRLYIHACKHWTQDRRATIARNTVSGLVLVAKSCGNDVSRLSFWLSNAIVLREIVSQAFGDSCQSSPRRQLAESNGKHTASKWNESTNSKQVNGHLQLDEDWQDTETFISALEKVESYVFSRIVESVWWQALAPHMQPPVGDPSANRSTGRLLGPSLGDQKQGSFSINLWRNAFQDAFQRLCPVRAAGHECGCLPVLARMVMEHCIGRLDVAMFNAILRESVHEIPTDPVSDPIVDSKVLPIPAGDLSFGSGAQLKNSVGNWSRWLTDMFGMDVEDCPPEDYNCEDDRRGGDSELQSFPLLNDLSDLLMLPKDMLMDRHVRHEVCPSICLPLVKRILCNFTPDEFCPDAVPGTVLEALNAECIMERRLLGDSIKSFPYTAAPVVYSPPSSANVAEKIGDAGGGKSCLARNASAVQRRGYTSDDELEELESPLTSIIDKLPSFPSAHREDKPNDHSSHTSTNSRYQLLRRVWSM